METEQINIRLSEKLLEVAKRYAENYGYKDVEELANDSIRKKVFEDNEFDDSFTEKEIKLVDSLINTSIEKQETISEDELNKTLLE